MATSSAPKNILITGCSTGIGAACVYYLAKAGHNVFCE